MAIGLHIVRVGLKNIDATGSIIDKTESTIGQVISSTSEHRVLANVAVPNSVGFPTIDNYLLAEAAQDYIPRHVDQYIIVTASESESASASDNIGAGAVNTVPIGVASTEILPANLTRELVVITNLSDERVDLAVGVAAESEKGIPLSAAAGESAGGSVTLTGSIAKLAINGICDSGAKNVSTQTGTTI